MNHQTHNAIVNFIWGIADDVLRVVCDKTQMPGYPSKKIGNANSNSFIKW